MTSTVNRDTFGVDVETCSGFVAARDAATAQAMYAELVRALYDGRLIHSEQTGVQSQNQNQRAKRFNGSGAAVVAYRRRAGRHSGFNTQHLKFEFHLQVFTPKLDGRSGDEVRGGSDAGFSDAGNADGGGGELLCAGPAHGGHGGDGADGGAEFRSERAQPAARGPETTQPPDLDGTTTDVMLKLDFQEDFVGRVTGQAGVNEMKLTERVVYSETRWAVQNLPFEVDGSGGVSIPQPSRHRAGQPDGERQRDGGDAGHGAGLGDGSSGRC